MGAVLPKVSIYLFLSVICLLINITMLVSGLVISGSERNVDDFLARESITINPESSGVSYDVTASDFAFTTGVAFVPFFSLLPITFIDFKLPDIFTSLWAVIIIIISTIQVLLIFLVVLNFTPKILGSGFDV